MNQLMWLPAVFGIVGTVLGVFVGQVLSAAREHINWVNDQKRLEYRELIDQLFQTITIVSKNRPNLRELNWEPINEAVGRLSRIFADRIFIADALENVKANEDWLAMKRVIYYEPELQSETPTDMRYSLTNIHAREDQLREKILEAAKSDIVKLKLSLR